MAFNVDSMRTDKNKETNGTWVDAGAGLKLLIARIGNPNYQSALSKDLSGQRQAFQGVGKIEAEVIQEATQKAIANHVLLGWEGMTEYKRDEKGDVVYDEKHNPVEVEVPYSKEKCLKVITEVPDFLEIVLAYAKKLETFKVELRAADAKN